MKYRQDNTRIKIIVRMDGGICSQIHQYLIGLYYSEKGYDVYYDLLWFYLDGKDLLGNKNRFFRLNKLIPNLRIKRSCIVRSLYYKKIYQKNSASTEPLPDIKKNAYLGGYYTLPSAFCIKKLTELTLNPTHLNIENERLKNTIMHDASAVAVHCRRGDIALENENGYWKEIQAEYYFKAMELFPGHSFYYFSDDILWVKQNIFASQRSSGKRIIICDVNSSSDGYLDLYLLSLFHRWICSEGTLGKMGCMLSKNKNKCIVLPNDRDQDFFSKLPHTQVVVQR